MRLFKILFIIVLLSSCTRVQFPQPSHVVGIWERVELGYSRLELDENANGNLIFASNEEEPEIYQIDSFQSEEEGFIFNVHQIYPDTDEVLTMKGTLYDEGILCLIEDGEEINNIEFCFMKSEAIEKSKTNALEILEDLNNKSQNNAPSGPDAA